MFRRTLLFIGLFAVALGCGKPKPAAVEEPVEVDVAPPPVDTAPLFKKLRSSSPTTQSDAIEALLKLIDKDPNVLPGLLDVVKDRPTKPAPATASGPTSPRDAAVMALLKAGPKGESLLLDKAMPILLDGLIDPDATVRANTAIAVGRLGKKGARAAVPLWSLAGDSDVTVREAALSALESLSPVDRTPLAKLLLHENKDVRSDVALALERFKPLPAESAEPLAAALKDEDPAVRTAAADALAALGPKAATAVPAIIALLKELAAMPNPKVDEPSILAPADALAAIGEPAVAPATKLLAEANPLARWFGAYVLAEIGSVGKSAQPELEKLFPDRDGTVALEAARAFLRCGGDATKAAELFKFVLGHADPSVRAAGLSCLARSGPGAGPLAPLAIGLFDDKIAKLRELAIEFVVALDPKDAKPLVPALAKRLASDDPEYLKVRVADALAELGPEAAGAAAELGIVAGSADADESARAAIEALMAIGPTGQAGLPGLLRTAANSKAPESLRAKAVLALSAVAPADATAMDAVLKASSDKSPEVRRAAARSLGAFVPPTPASISRLIELATADRDYPTRSRAIRSLALLGPASRMAKDPLTSIAAGSPSEMSLWAKVALARIEGKPVEGVAVARTALVSKSLPERITAIDVLSEAPPEAQDLPILLGMLTDPTVEVRRAASTALGTHKGGAKSAVPKLVDLMKDRDADVRIAAAAALGSIGEQSSGAIKALRDAAKLDPAVGRVARRSLRQLGVPPGETRPGR